MKPSKYLIFGVIALALGGFLGWILRPVFESNRSVLPVFGGNADCQFRAEVTWHPETKLEGQNDMVVYDTTWVWKISNRSESPIQFSIPKQQFRDGGQFVDLPDTMLVASPIMIEPGETREFTAAGGGISWQKVEDVKYQF